MFECPHSQNVRPWLSRDPPPRTLRDCPLRKDFANIDTSSWCSIKMYWTLNFFFQSHLKEEVCHYLHQDEETVASFNLCDPDSIHGLILQKNRRFEVIPLNSRLKRMLDLWKNTTKYDPRKCLMFIIIEIFCFVTGQRKKRGMETPGNQNLWNLKKEISTLWKGWKITE